MSDTVVDSSVVAKWILPEADSAEAQLFVFESAQRNERLVILDLVYAEVANAIWKQYHRGLARLAEARIFLDSLLRCPVQVDRRLVPSTCFRDCGQVSAKHLRFLVRGFGSGSEVAGHYSRRTSLPGD